MQTAGGPARSPVAGPPGRSSSASPSSSSSAVSAPHLGFDPVHNHQQQQPRQFSFRQSLQQQQQQHQQRSQHQLQQIPKSDCQSVLWPQSNNTHGYFGGTARFPPLPVPSLLSHQSGKFMDLPRQEGRLQNRDENQSKGLEQEPLPQNLLHQTYLNHAVQTMHQQSHGNVVQGQTQGHRTGLMVPPQKDQEMYMNNLKMQELMSLQAANQAQASNLRRFPEPYGLNEKPAGQSSSNEVESIQGHMSRLPLQVQQGTLAAQSFHYNQVPAPQLHAIHRWAVENNIDLSLPANANLVAQLLPIWQSKMAAMQQSNDNMMSQQSRNIAGKHQSSTPPQAVLRETNFHTSSVSSGEISRPSSSASMSYMSTPPNTISTTISGNSLSGGNVVHTVPLPASPISTNQNTECLQPRSQSTQTAEAPDMQYARPIQQLNRVSQQHSLSSAQSSGSHPSIQGCASVAQMSPQSFGFTKQQLHVLKAQILAFRRLKRGEGSLPQEVLRAIVPPALDAKHLQQNFLNHAAVIPDKAQKIPEKKLNQSKSKDGFSVPSPSVSKMVNSAEEQSKDINSNEALHGNHPQDAEVKPKESALVNPVAKEEETLSNTGSVKSDQENEQMEVGEYSADANTTKANKQLPSTTDGQAKQTSLQKDCISSRKYYGPLFDFSYFSRRPDTGLMASMNSSNNLTLSYDVKDLLSEEGREVFKRKREENLGKIKNLLDLNLARKRIRPELVLRLQIEEKKLRLMDLQARLRDEIDLQQQDIMAMPDRPYRKFIRLCERQRMELLKQVQLSQKVMREKQLKAVFQWRKKLLEAHWAIRDARITRNRGIAKYHERMLREFSKRKDDDRNRRMEALKNNDVDRYREMLLEQQTNVPGDAAQRYTVLSSFLSQTEDYLNKLGCKITAAKNQQEIEEAAIVAATAARSQGLSEEEVRAAAACAGEEVMIRNRFSEMNAPKDKLSINKYYNLAHAVNEKVLRQPSMLRAGTLRDYQLIGLQWMLSLYNNKLNGILADEMGLGKTVQVMALIAYLMEFKGNYGPHLIIVPNAVLVNWKSEFHNWLPSVSCIFYVGSKDQRQRLFSQDVCAMKFNVLVTTYEFVMYDRTKLSKVDWRYIVIDEAQRMKDRDSVLARDLDKYRCQRRLLLTGTPLQNDLKELWSLLNLLLPEVFDNKKAFHDWFSKPFQKDGASQGVEDDWLETEKKVIIIHRLHQILEPFMLRRRVEDVEGSLPPKVSIVLRCKMSALQGAIYDWIKSTGTIRLDPEEEQRILERKPAYQVKTYKNVNNKCMELRKVCNHPLLNYPFFNEYSKDFLVRSCGKLWVLDRILIKLQRTSHRVLLFSTMTKLLDILEEYLQWRRFAYRRIDGTTSLEERESAIVDFNSPESGCFIFLLSIRAAGRGLNLQSADTVIIYDPDPNPKNEEQAVARAHRIGQKREVKVIYMEAVVDKISSHQKEDELRNDTPADLEDDLAGEDRYIGSIESLIRNNIQQYKIDMADEVINAGRFDQRTTHEERRMTLEALLHDEERYQENVHDVPSLHEVNRMIARSKEEVELFDQMDEELDWVGEMIKHDQVPKWLRVGTPEVNALIANMSKKSSKGLGVSFGLDSSMTLSDLSQGIGERRRARSKGIKRYLYELDDENIEYSEASSEERNGFSVHEENEVAENEEEFCDTVGVPGSEMHLNDRIYDGHVECGDGYGYSGALEIRNNHMFEEAISTASSESQRLAMVAPTSSQSFQKFGSLSALDAPSASMSRIMQDDLEEGEIALSGDSHMDLQQSWSWTHERDDGEEEQVLQPKIKRKRSLRPRPRSSLERPYHKPTQEKRLIQQGRNSLAPDACKYIANAKELRPYSGKPDLVESLHRQTMNALSKRDMDSSKWYAHNTSMLNFQQGDREDGAEHSVGSWDEKIVIDDGGSICYGSKMSEAIQRKCKNVCSRFQRRILKDGYQVAPLITGFWRRMEHSAVDFLDLQKIYMNIERSQYATNVDFITDVQLMLKNSVQCCGSSYEVKVEAKKLQEIFFDILKSVFPDVEEKGLGVCSTQGLSTPGLITNQTRYFRLAGGEVDSVEPPLCRAVIMEDSETGKLSHSSRLCKQSSTLNSSNLHDSEEGLHAPAHPGELVICKKKRKDRDKVHAKPRPALCIGHDTAKSQHCLNGWISQQNQQHLFSGKVVSDVQWAKPVKRMRTDTGKRRPSHF